MTSGQHGFKILRSKVPPGLTDDFVPFVLPHTETWWTCSICEQHGGRVHQSMRSTHAGSANHLWKMLHYMETLSDDGKRRDCCASWKVYMPELEEQYALHQERRGMLLDGYKTGTSPEQKTIARLFAEVRNLIQESEAFTPHAAETYLQEMAALPEARRDLAWTALPSLRSAERDLRRARANADHNAITAALGN